MSTVGIVCEYNPFHKGHEYQIQQAKLLTGAEHVICFMSGNFLQRGVPAIADKHTRTEIALRCGVDAVFEIPFVYASSSARDYAHAAVCMMNALDGIDYISFGAECDDMDLLQKIAELTVNEPPQVSEFIKNPYLRASHMDQPEQPPSPGICRTRTLPVIPALILTVSWQARTTFWP